MRSQLALTADNAAFGETRADAAEEIARILETVARDLRHDPENYGRCWETLLDINGNDVGRFCLKGDGDPR